jgi:hypothetical protein
MSFVFWREPIPKDVDWNEFCKKVLTMSRVLYKQSGFEETIENKLFDRTFLPPCQIEVLDSGAEVVWLVVHDDKVADMTFKILTNVKNYSESSFAKKYNLNSLPRDFLSSKPASARTLWIFMKDSYYTDFSADAEEFATQLFQKLEAKIFSEVRKNQFDVIQSSTEGLKKSLSSLEEGKSRRIMEDVAKTIDKAVKEVKRIDEYEKKLSSMEKDIVSVRQLVGASQEFQDWRVLIADVEDLKKANVSKELFKSEIKRLDEKIDGLREIRFWSKRTLLDIVLASVASASTIIASLLAMGVIHF